MDVLGSRGAGRADKTFSKKDDKSEDCCGGARGERLDGGVGGISIHFSTPSPFFRRCCRLSEAQWGTSDKDTPQEKQLDTKLSGPHRGPGGTIGG